MSEPVRDIRVALAIQQVGSAMYQLNRTERARVIAALIIAFAISSDEVKALFKAPE